MRNTIFLRPSLSGCSGRNERASEFRQPMGGQHNFFNFFITAQLSYDRKESMIIGIEFALSTSRKGKTRIHFYDTGLSR